MSYYDYDHFWAPNEVCGQKRENVEDQKLLLRLKELSIQIWDEVFPKKNLESDDINGESFNEEKISD